MLHRSAAALSGNRLQVVTSNVYVTPQTDLTQLPAFCRAHRSPVPPRRTPDTPKRDGNAAVLTARLSDATWQRETCRGESPRCTHWSPAVSGCVPCSAPCSPTGWCCTPTSPPRTCGTVWSAGATCTIPPQKTNNIKCPANVFNFNQYYLITAFYYITDSFLACGMGWKVGMYNLCVFGSRQAHFNGFFIVLSGDQNF